MNVPFSVFNTDETTEESTVRVRRVRETGTVLDHTNDVLNRLNVINDLGLFSDVAIDSVRQHASRIKMLNVYMMCWAYEVIIAINKQRSRTGRGTLVERDIRDEVRSDDYNEIRAYLVKGKHVDSGEFHTSSEIELITYIHFIRDMDAES
jgi:hypothetical protein